MFMRHRLNFVIVLKYNFKCVLLSNMNKEVLVCMKRFKKGKIMSYSS